MKEVLKWFLAVLPVGSTFFSDLFFMIVTFECPIAVLLVIGLTLSLILEYVFWDEYVKFIEQLTNTINVLEK